jgi:hypothetical protein
MFVLFFAGCAVEAPEYIGAPAAVAETQASFSGVVFGTPTPEGARVDFRIADAVDLWLKVDDADGRVWVYSVSFDVLPDGTHDVSDVHARVCSGIDAYDTDAPGVVCTYPNEGVVSVTDGVATFELAREGAQTLIGGFVNMKGGEA